MRIVHTCLRYSPATGGAEKYISEIVEGTRKIPERDVRVLTSKMRTHHPISELDPELLLDDPMYVQRLHHMKTPIFAYPRLQALRHYIGHHQPEILHSYGFWYQPADITARYANKHHIPFIFTPFFYPRNKLTWQLYKNSIGKKTFSAADVVVVISPFEQKLTQEAGFQVRRFELIPPGINFTKFQTTHPNPFLKKKLIGKIILAVSRLAPGKGLEELVGAFPEIVKQIPDTHLVIIGEDFGIQKILQEISAKNVHFWGRLEDAELVEAYQHADVFLHPSRYEAFGIVLAEALAAGIPIVARNTSAIPYVAPHDTAGLLFTSKDELIKNTVTLLQNENLRQQLGAAGKHHIQENFSWDKSVAKILKLYDEFRR